MKLTELKSRVPTTPPVLRSLGAFEEFLWLIDQNRPTHFALIAEVTGHTTIPEWRRALDRVQQRHPLFSVCIEMNGESVPYFRKDTVPIPLRVVQGTNAVERWELETELELSIPVDARQAPLVRAVLLHEEQQAACILVTHHSIADGRSVAFVIRDLLQAVSGNQIGSLPVIPPLEEILGVTTEEQAAADSPSSVETLPWVNKEARPRITSLQLTPELTSKVRERARQEGTTVHGALSSAFALAYWRTIDELNPEPIRILSPIDIRNMLGLGEDCAFLIGSGAVTIDPYAATTFWEIARSAMAGLAKAQTLEAITAARKGLSQILAQRIDVLTAAAIAAQGFAHNILLTNLGNLPYGTDFGQLRLKAVWGPAVSARMVGGETIGVATANGALRLLHTSFAPLESLLETAKEILISACATKKHVSLAEGETGQLHHGR